MERLNATWFPEFVRISFFVSFPFPLSLCLNYSSLLLFSFLLTSPFFSSQLFSLLYLFSFIISFSIFFNHHISPFLQFFFLRFFLRRFFPSFPPSVIPSFLLARLSTPRHYRHPLLSRDTQQLRFNLISNLLRHQLINSSVQPFIMFVTQRCCLLVLSLRLESLL